MTFGHFLDSGVGLGNQIFILSAVVYVAELTGRRPAIVNLTYETTLEQVFDLGIPRRPEPELCPCLTIAESISSHALRYDVRVERAVILASRVRTVVVYGFFQSWKYRRLVDARLRRHLAFRREIADFVDRFMEASAPPNWVDAGRFVRVGVHVRRGDVLSADKVEFGLTTPTATYFRRAMAYFVDRYAPRVQFVVAGNDMPWCLEQFPRIVDELMAAAAVGGGGRKSTGGGVELQLNVTYSVGHSAGQDLALLARCDHVIVSTGTFGWSAAWLAKGDAVYFEDWPRNGSTLAASFDRRDYFPPAWVGMNDR